MKRKLSCRYFTLIAALAIGSVSMGILPCPAIAQPAKFFFVDPTGNDANPGTKEKPLATIEGIQKAVAGEVKAGLKSDIRVVFAPGRYELTGPWVIGPDQSGTDKFSITYTSAESPDQSPAPVVISGGRKITGWTKGDGDLWSAKLPAAASGAWWFRQLTLDGVRLTRARHPNTDGMLELTEVTDEFHTLTVKGNIPNTVAKAEQAELVVLQNWSLSRGRIDKIDGRTITTATPMAWLGHDACAARAGMACFLEHSRSFLDVPWEWFLDHDGQTVYAIILRGENPNDHNFIAPALQTLVQVRGESSKPVRNVRFFGIAFENAGWDIPSFGYRGIQAGYHGIKSDGPAFCQPAAIELAYASDCRIEWCSVAHTDAGGIALGAGCRNNAIVGCVISDIGGNGVHIGHRDKALLGEQALDADWPNPEQVPVGNSVTNCVLTDCGQVSYGAVGIFSAFTRDTRIAHNLVHRMPYTGVSVGFRWDPTPTSQKSNIVEYNHIYDVMRRLADGGCIYTLGRQPGTVLRGNLLHDAHRTPTAFGGAPNNGIFFDEGTTELLVENNIIFATSGEPIRFNQCGENGQQWKNNDFRKEELPADKIPANSAGLEPAWQKRLKP
ncbi:MAG: right-handed parallel beta-helix repeat-containing protein [Phycisphaerae bacterium]|nr:right-handed parallel beta-helix repeat-containing protein [Phycisphaerae bacterium]